MYFNHFCVSGVGKTSLVRRYTEDKWNPAGTASTTGAFFVTHKTDFKGTRVKLQIWDTAGRFFVFFRLWVIAVELLPSVVCQFGPHLRKTSMACWCLDLQDRRVFSYIVLRLPLMGVFRTSSWAYHLNVQHR